jgi:hypothetical protein
MTDDASSNEGADFAIRAALPADVTASIVRLITASEFELPPRAGDARVARATPVRRGRSPARTLAGCRVRALLHQLLDLPRQAGLYLGPVRRAGQRGQGIGRAMLEHLARLAARAATAASEWSVLDWNEARSASTSGWVRR